MAISLSLTGWANELKEFEWGSVLKVAHKNRRKNDAGEWETISTDYVDVVIDASNRAEFAHVFEAELPSRITLEGNAKFGTYEGKNGTGISIKVYPKAIVFDDVQIRAVSDVPF